MFYLMLIGIFLSLPAHADNNLGLPSLKIPADNPQFEEKINLGRDFFHDPRFSSDGSVSCASCHQKEKAFTDGLAVSKGIKGLTGLRNAPTVVNAAYFEKLFVDGRANSLEEQALGPMLNPVEHGLDNEQKILEVVLKNTQYKQRLQQVFNISKQEISVQHVAKAIASFERTLIAGNSRFDQYYFGRDRNQLSDSEARGLRIFKRKGNCANCHEISFNNALFSDNRFYNIGVGFKPLQPQLDDLLAAIKAGEDPSQFPLTDKQRSELGRFNVTKHSADIGKFKTPMLRNIALTAPYMHDGSLPTLEEVVEYYDKGGDKNKYLDAAIFPLNLSAQEKMDLVAFMKALTSAQLL